MWVSGHLLIGYALTKPKTIQAKIKKNVFLGTLGFLFGSILPDYDVIIGAVFALLCGGDIHSTAYAFHHTFSHSIVLMAACIGATLLLTIKIKNVIFEKLPYFVIPFCVAAILHSILDMFWLDPVGILWPFWHKINLVVYDNETIRLIIMNIDLLLAAAIFRWFSAKNKNRLSQNAFSFWKMLAIIFAGLFLTSLILTPLLSGKNTLLLFINFAILLSMIFFLLVVSYLYSRISEKTALDKD